MTEQTEPRWTTTKAVKVGTQVGFIEGQTWPLRSAHRQPTTWMTVTNIEVSPNGVKELSFDAPHTYRPYRLGGATKLWVREAPEPELDHARTPMTGLSSQQRKALAALHANIGPSGSAFGVSPATLAITLETSPEGAAATASSLVRRNLAERAKAGGKVQYRITAVGRVVAGAEAHKAPPNIEPETPICHRHEDGTEHEHGGRAGFEIGGQVIADTYGDERSHSHSTLSLIGEAPGPSSGPVVWSERDPDQPDPDDRNTQPNGGSVTPSKQEKYDRLQRAKEQHQALKAWEKAGGDLAEPRTPRPETPDLDAVNAEHEAEEAKAERRRTEAKAEQDALVDEHKGKKQEKRKQPAPPATDTEETAMPKPTTNKASSSRRSPGALREQVLAFLQRRGQKAEGYSPATIGKAIEASSGAVGNALDKLTTEGITRRVSDKPKRYAVIAKAERQAS